MRDRRLAKTTHPHPRNSFTVLLQTPKAGITLQRVLETTLLTW